MEYLNDLSEMFIQEEKERKKIISEFKRKLEGLINITELFKYLDDMAGWTPKEIVDIVLTDEKESGYSNYQHARIINDKDKLLYMKTSSDEVRGIDYSYVWQTVGCCEDDYSGYLLFPLENGKYFKVSYSC